MSRHAVLKTPAPARSVRAVPGAGLGTPEQPGAFAAAAGWPGLEDGPRLIWRSKGEPEAVTHGSLRRAERHLPRAPELAAPAIPNLLVHGDNGALLRAMEQEPLASGIAAAGGLKLIYIDPPFAVGNDFPVTIDLGGGRRAGPRIRYPAYRDTWNANGEDYLNLMHRRLASMHALLAEGGCLFLHCDWRSHAHLRLILDEVFGRGAFVNEIVWFYYNKYSAGRHCLPRSHDTILFYAKGGAPRLNEVRLPREKPRRQLVRENVGGVLKNARGADGKLLYRTVSDRKLPDVWEIPQLQPASRHWTGYPTQKHPELIARILALCTQPGDLVADFFCGAGTLPVVAASMGRPWIGCDATAIAVHWARKRLIEAGTGFELAQWDADGSPMHPPGRLEVEAVANGNGVRIALTGLDPTPLEPGLPWNGTANGLPFDRLELRGDRLIRLARSRRSLGAEVLIGHWPDWIDYWAVDFGEAAREEGAPFQPDWWSLRSRGSSRLALQSPPHRLARPGRHAITVMAVDRLGREYRANRKVAVSD